MLLAFYRIARHSARDCTFAFSVLPFFFFFFWYKPYPIAPALSCTFDPLRKHQETEAGSGWGATDTPVTKLRVRFILCFFFSLSLRWHEHPNARRVPVSSSTCNWILKVQKIIENFLHDSTPCNRAARARREQTFQGWMILKEIFIFTAVHSFGAKKGKWMERQKRFAWCRLPGGSDFLDRA